MGLPSFSPSLCLFFYVSGGVNWFFDSPRFGIRLSTPGPQPYAPWLTCHHRRSCARPEAGAPRAGGPPLTRKPRRSVRKVFLFNTITGGGQKRPPSSGWALSPPGNALTRWGGPRPRVNIRLIRNRNRSVGAGRCFRRLRSRGVPPRVFFAEIRTCPGPGARRWPIRRRPQTVPPAPCFVLRRNPSPGAQRRGQVVCGPPPLFEEVSALPLPRRVRFSDKTAQTQEVRSPARPRVIRSGQLWPVKCIRGPPTTICLAIEEAAGPPVSFPRGQFSAQVPRVGEGEDGGFPRAWQC